MRTPVRTLRVPEDLWRAAVEKAATEGTSVTEVLVRALKRYVARR